MEAFQQYRKDAAHALMVADHMLTVTYPMVQDTKILFNVLTNIYKSMIYAVKSMLSYELLFKRIPSYPDNIQSYLEVFSARCERRYSLDPTYLHLLKKIHEMIEMHKTSPIEFSRKDKFVICSDNYRLSTITAAQLKEYLQKAKLFIDAIHGMTSKHERIFRGSTDGIQAR
ncbi:MAG: hypothetical protein ABIH34_03770 [Nanoarchaeota archaeon]